ncbi:coproporphyrinogen III oxidase [Clostridium algidicarnis]|uniref:Coproporphyrinogen III oxidase n=1 Tax=Clostridium algidicarnis TaxID=37659 RepID=A0ABS6BZI5_9CLOT|nr:coproporphyrinogen III oxidase [Clostridium algidicarnis]MBB6630544.1 coproporphyrinogen III oxidase [Clostridium algidicarnis]MBB6696319.1 coproporphyrinogen III oxidase [Clostridium algidicarnis]MBU3193538.1 coproporphyrinogen III oxidase [Clostridium algidicarnis]MBU3203056.1 coproporphyrinogen III oxidase [Clostridium algidicarnis]MBU3205645.1 coproporphyrinogen III oxidase [Clostridium algidicarnis]
MSVNIKLNDMNYRYEVYQIVSLFHSLEEITFSKIEEIKLSKIEKDFCIDIEERFIEISGKDFTKNFEFNEEDSKKNQIKRYIYLYFSKLYSTELPWGTLIGIRPSKIALNLVKQGYSEEEIIEYFNHKYLVKENKVKLCIKVAKHEKNFINTDKNNISIYLGMPFCPTRCLYCSFASNPISGNKSLVEPYINALIKEIKELSHFIKLKNLNINTIYFGGGTPTAVGDSDFEYVMKNIYENLIKDFKVTEFTVECGRPDSITKNKLQTMKSYLVDRISINPQTMNDNTLKIIGRNHSVEDVIDKFNMARNLGFNNINMDIILGLPGEKSDDVNHTLDVIKDIAPESITVHGLSVKRASKLYEDLKLNKNYELANQDEITKMYDGAKNIAEDLNMEPYYMYRQKNMPCNMENIGYSVLGKECIYNMQIIEERQTIIALGADAVSKVVFLDENRIERFANIKDVGEYIKRIDEVIEKKKALLETLYK